MELWDFVPGRAVKAVPLNGYGVEGELKLEPRRGGGAVQIMVAIFQKTEFVHQNAGLKLSEEQFFC